MNEELYLSADETSQILKISVATIYAYVSRGLIRSQKVPGSKKRLYWRGDVERLRRDVVKGVAAGDLPEKLVESTGITLITPGGHFYRGVSALALAQTATLEDTAALLWECNVETIFAQGLPDIPATALKARQKGETIWQRTLRLLSALEQGDPRAYNLTMDGYARSGGDGLRCVAAACLDLPTISARPIHLLIGETLKADEAMTDVLRQYLVLAADHELDPTTYCVRAAANTGVTPYAAISAGLLSSSGRRLVFGQTGSMSRMLDEIDREADPRKPMNERIREGQPLPGFGSRPYRDGDPRADHLLRLLRETCGHEKTFQRLEGAIAAVFEATGQRPSFVIPALFLERRMGIRAEQTTMLRLARCVGWVAHAMEQYYDHSLVRPHADYTGRLPGIDGRPYDASPTSIDAIAQD